MSSLTGKESILRALNEGKLSVDGAYAMLKYSIGKPNLISLTSMQAGIWTIQYETPESAAYNIPIVLRFDSKLDHGYLKSACRDLLVLFPLLTAVIDTEIDAYRPGLKLFGCFSSDIDFDDTPSDDPDLRFRLQKIKDRPFDLSSGPLWRALHFIDSSGKSVLLLTVHHLIFDGGSVAPFVSALMAFYGKRANGHSLTVIPMEFDYVAFASSEGSFVDSPAGVTALSYWENQLSGDLPILDLPTDYVRPMKQTHRGEVFQQIISDHTITRLRELSASAGVSRSGVMLASFAAFLHRLTGQEDIAIGVPVTGRIDRRFDGSIGNFANMLSIRSRSGLQEKFSSYLKQIQSVLNKGLDHSSYPFPLLVKHLKVQRSSARTPVFQTMFAYQNFIEDSFLNSLREHYGAELWNGVHQEGEIDLGLEVFEHSNKLELNFKYDSELFARETIARMLECFIHFLSQIFDVPDRAISEYQMVSHEEYQLTVKQWNATDATYPSDTCFHEWFRRQAVETPDRIAVICGEQSLTYAVLNEKSERLGIYLQRLGVGPGKLIGICMKRTCDLIVALLGAMKSGAAYVPIDPEYPTDRIRHILSDSGVSFVLTQYSLKDIISDISARNASNLVLVDSDWSAIESTAHGDELVSNTTPEDLVYVIYTSGSTGLPKGVMIPHRALMNLLWAMAREPGIEPQDKMLALASFAFDMSVPELYLPLLKGAQCILCDSNLGSDPEVLIQEIRRHRPTIMQATPTTCFDADPSGLAQ